MYTAILALTILVLLLILVIREAIKVYTKLSAGRCNSPVCLIGKTVLVTGGNSGIGYQTALALAGRGCRVIIADRDNCDGTKAQIIQETGNTNIVVKQFDLASLRSVRRLAEDINRNEERLDVLVNNAGMGYNLKNNHTDDGLHEGMQVNHFGSFLLTHLLVGLLKKSAPSRIIFVSSIASFLPNLSAQTLNIPEDHPTNTQSAHTAYANAKLCNIITANEFARNLEGTGVTSNSLHPGVIYTSVFRSCCDVVLMSKLRQILLFLVVNPFLKTVEEGAQTTLHLVLAKEVQNVTGKFFVDCQPYRMPSLAKDRTFSEKIWKLSEEYVKLRPEEKLKAILAA